MRFELSWGDCLSGCTEVAGLNCAVTVEGEVIELVFGGTINKNADHEICPMGCVEAQTVCITPALPAGDLSGAVDRPDQPIGWHRPIRSRRAAVRGAAEPRTNYFIDRPIRLRFRSTVTTVTSTRSPTATMSWGFFTNRSAI